MKRVKNLYPAIISRENLYRSAYAAARSKRLLPAVADFNYRLEEEIDSLHVELSKKTYRHGPYRNFVVYEPKERRIAAAPFRDRVVHHAVHDVLEPLCDGSFIHDSYACRRGKGTQRCVDRAESFIKASRYALHGDVRKYFPSVDHDILKSILRRRIADKDLLRLLDKIIDSARPKGLPIGNITSQFFANLYLNELDQFVKHELRQTRYLRYMDDFLVFGDNRAELMGVRNDIRDFLKQRLNLEIHEGKTIVYDLKGGIKFLGFRLNGRTRRLASENVRRFRRRFIRWRRGLENRRLNPKNVRERVLSWCSHARLARTRTLRERMRHELCGLGSAFEAAAGEVLAP